MKVIDSQGTINDGHDEYTQVASTCIIFILIHNTKVIITESQDHCNVAILQR
jgi:hypothetical protein